MPGGAPDRAVQKKFAKRIIRTIKRATQHNETVLFLDPTHQVHNTVNDYCWQATGKTGTKTIASNSGRKRITIIGAMNAVTHQPTTLITESNCDKEVMKCFLEEVRKDYSGSNRVYVFLDNARYSWNKEVIARSKQLRIKLIFLPPYSPNLNLIERLWKFMKQKVTANKYYKTFLEFKNAIDDFFKHMKHYATELNTLLTLKFEIL